MPKLLEVERLDERFAPSIMKTGVVCACHPEKSAAIKQDMVPTKIGKCDSANRKKCEKADDLAEEGRREKIELVFHNNHQHNFHPHSQHPDHQVHYVHGHFHVEIQEQIFLQDPAAAEEEEAEKKIEPDEGPMKLIVPTLSDRSERDYHVAVFKEGWDISSIRVAGEKNSLPSKDFLTAAPVEVYFPPRTHVPMHIYEMIFAGIFAAPIQEEHFKRRVS